MKFTVFFTALTPTSLIPWDYPSKINAWVYRVLNRANPHWGNASHFSRHQNIQPFALSWLDFPAPPRFTSAGIVPTSPLATLSFNTADAALAMAFQTWAPQEPLILNSMVFRTDAIVETPPHSFITSYVAQLTTPLVLTHKVSPVHSFVSPSDEDFLPLLQKNLAHKTMQFYHQMIPLSDITFDLPTTWQRKLLRIHQFAVVGWISKEPLTISGPPSLLQAADTFGLGVSNSQGFGHLEALLDDPLESLLL